ncbi:hypothetical protein GX50_01055 [[Emmonsia] crescens]|uniref:Myb-like domain-containing protein n=1 Tax=[Emmonsia] crescens TaxID=73230 RepID=A0A2B7ZS70_9EURO|nr:hypothetical protein GX50_01055 [Emmonsia crescens]
MGFGQPPTPTQDLLLVALKILTTLRWQEIAEAYDRQFSTPSLLCRPSARDCRSRWARGLTRNVARLALEAGRPLHPTDEIQVRIFLQAEGMYHLNDLSLALLATPPPIVAPTPQFQPSLATTNASPTMLSSILYPTSTHHASPNPSNGQYPTDDCWLFYSP